MNKKAIILFIFFIFSFFISLFLNFDKINVPYFNGINKNVQTDIILKNKDNLVDVFYNDIKINKPIKIDEKHYLYKIKTNPLIKKISFSKTDNIKQLIIYNGNDIEFVDNIQKEIKIDNSKNYMDKISVSFLSFFYNPQYYLISYVFFFLFLYNFQYKNSNYRKSFLLIFFLGIFLRCSMVNYIPFWDDEIYVLAHCSEYAKIVDLFNDPGNPPLYFIIFKLYRLIVNNPEYFRYCSIIIGLLFNLAFFNYIKFSLGKKKALLGLFIVSINIILIYFSQELRCYMLLMLLCVLSSYLLFNYKKQNRILYLFTIIATLYTHFYGALFVFYNFLFGISLFKNNQKRLFNFLGVNILSFLSFLPLIIYKFKSITTTFNSWLRIPILEDYYLVIRTLFGGVIIMTILFSFLVVLYKKVNKNKKIFIKYNVFLIFTVFILAILVSYIVKPIFCYRYFYVVFQAVLSLICFVVGYSYKTNKRMILSFVLLLIFTINLRVNYQNLFCNHNLFLDFIRHDNLIDNDKTKEKYVFLSDTVKDYKEFYIENTNFVYLPINQGIETFNISDNKYKKNTVLYVLNLYLENDVLKQAKNIELYKTPVGVFCKIIM